MQLTVKPLDRLIDFSGDVPRLCWVSSTNLIRHYAVCIDDKWYINVAHNFDDADEGRGTHIDAKKVQPYSDRLWAACQRWQARATELQQDFLSLSKGKIKDEQIAMWKG